MKTRQGKLKNRRVRTASKWPGDDTSNGPVLRFSPTAWAKLLFFRDRGETEISGFGITGPDDLLYVTEFTTIKQQASAVSISLDDEAVADLFETQVDAGRKPEDFFRIWCHSHPGDSPQPSSTDEKTFQRVFGRCSWAVMFILAGNSDTFARLHFNAGPGGQMLVPVVIDYEHPFGPCDRDAWEAEYKANIKAIPWSVSRAGGGEVIVDPELHDYSLPIDLIEELEEMEPEERRAVLGELAGRPDLWDEEGEVAYYE